MISSALLLEPGLKLPIGSLSGLVSVEVLLPYDFLFIGDKDLAVFAYADSAKIALGIVD